MQLTPVQTKVLQALQRKDDSLEKDPVHKMRVLERRRAKNKVARRSRKKNRAK